MKRYTSTVATLAILASLAFSLIAYAATATAKKYQVTGTVTTLTDAVITVQKPDGDKWEINRDPSAAAQSDLKVGAKVTIQYTMTASDIKVK
jgi:hypothetical protein